MENRLKRMLADGALTFCLSVNQARIPKVTMIAAAAGFDAIYVDLEHNPTRGARADVERMRTIPVPRL
jgi:2-keto-3-deoxy-L-rhamnonate aldolase RhmA